MAENPALPLLDEGLRIKDVRKHLDRTLCLHVVVGCSFGFPRDKAWKWIESEMIHDELTESDRNFLSGEDSLRLQKQADVHCLYVLVWALSFVPSLTTDGQIPGYLVQKMPELWNLEPASSFRNDAIQRSSGEILEALDLAFCLHWSLEDARISGAKSPSLETLPVVVRRRLALEWLASSSEWDEIRLDT
jgi:hypothetical protein